MPDVSFKVNPEYAQITEVVPGLYICGVPNLKSLGNIPRIKLWIEDDAESHLVLPHFETTSDQIQAELDAGGNVLVHCVAGVSRSAAICLAYLTKYKCRSLREAYHLMASKRPMVRPVLGFWRQLISFEQNVKKVPATVRLIHDEAQPEKLLPDIYLKSVLPGKPQSTQHTESSKDEKYHRFNAGTKRKFQPVLEPLSEISEMVT